MAQSSNLARNKINASTQQYLDIMEIKDDTVIMRDGTLRAVLLASSINFALKSEDEQEAVISAYVMFLNNLSFNIEIVVQSRQLNIDGHIAYLKEKEKMQTNRLLKMQTADYIEYIKDLTEMGNIINKRFYVVVPYSPLSDKHKGFFSLLKESLKPASYIKLKEKSFIRHKELLDRRLDSVIGGLNSMGISSVRLDTQALIELYYRSYNPETSKNQDLIDIDELRVEQ